MLRLRSHESLMHRGHLPPELPQDRCPAASAFPLIPPQSSSQPQRLRAVQKHAHVVDPAQMRMVEKPESIDQNHGRGPPCAGFLPPRVRGEIINRQECFRSLAEFLQHPGKCLPVDGPGIVEVDVLPLGWSEVRKIAVKVVQRKHRAARAEGMLDLSRKPRLARSTAADNGNKPGSPWRVSGARLPR